MCGEIKLLRYKILCEDVPVGYEAVKQLADTYGVSVPNILKMIRIAIDKDVYVENIDSTKKYIHIIFHKYPSVA